MIRRAGFPSIGAGPGRGGGPADAASAWGGPQGRLRVSVVIPCYNHSAYLGEAIESALRQTWPDVEVVVVDDGSTDESAEVAGRYPQVRVLRQPNRGLGHARNAGLAASRGEVVIFLDADDRLRPGAARAGIRVLGAHPGAMMAFGRCAVIDARGAPLRAMTLPVSGDIYAALLRRNHIWTPGVAAWRRDVFSELGAFDTRCDPAADYDLYLRAARRFRVAAHDEVVAEYRQHGGNMSERPHLMRAATVQVMRRQRRHVRGDPSRTRAYRDGMREWRAYYGERMVARFRAALRRPGGRLDALIWALRLLHAYPSGVLYHLWRKARTCLSRARGTTTAEPSQRPR